MRVELGGLAQLETFDALSGVNEEPVITPQQVADYNLNRLPGTPIYAPGHAPFWQGYPTPPHAVPPGSTNQPFWKGYGVPPPPPPPPPTYDFGENSGRQGL